MSDYLFRRPWATSKAPWQPISPVQVPPLEVPITEEQIQRRLLPERAAGAMRAAATAYVLLLATAVPPDDPPLQRQHIGEPQRIPLRASNEAYWLPNRLTTEAQELPGDRPRGYLDLIPRPQRRAANSVYWLDNFLAVPELAAESPTVELRRIVMPVRAPAAPRAAYSAYVAGGGAEDFFAATPPGATILAQERAFFRRVFGRIWGRIN